MTENDLPKMIPLDETSQLKLENSALRVELAKARVADAQRDLMACTKAQFDLQSEALQEPLKQEDGKVYEQGDWNALVKRYGFHEPTRSLVLLPPGRV